MNHSSRPQTIAWFRDHYTAGRLTLRPPFQRKPVWTDKQRHSLVESVLLDIPIPEVYVQVILSDDGVEEFGVVDGQQRLRTILQFVGLEQADDQDGEDNNNFALDSLHATATHKDVRFAELPVESKKKLFRYEICVRFLNTEDTKEVEDVFKRLNKFATPLKAQELRNATFHGAFAVLSEKLADDDYWAVNKIVTPAAIRRMGDIEMMSDLLIGLLHGPQGGASKVIDQYYENYELYDEVFPEQERITKEFGATLDTVKRVFPNISSESRWSNRADFYSLFVCLAHMLRAGELYKAKEGPLRLALQKFADDVNRIVATPSLKVSAEANLYAGAIIKGSNDKARRTDRQEALVIVMAGFFKVKTGG